MQNLWKKLSLTGKLKPNRFPDSLEKLIQSSIPEALTLSEIVARRISAIREVQSLVENGNKEIEIHPLITKFPWLLGSEWEKLTPTPSLRTLCEKLSTPSTLSEKTLTEIENISHKHNSAQLDFVFLSDPNVKREIVLFGLKGAKNETKLQFEDFDLLRSHLDLIHLVDVNFPAKGILVGHQVGGLASTDRRIEITTWNDVFNRARNSYLDYLQTLLVFSDEIKPNDQRIDFIREIGDSEVNGLLNQLFPSAARPKVG